MYFNDKKIEKAYLNLISEQDENNEVVDFDLVCKTCKTGFTKDNVSSLGIDVDQNCPCKDCSGKLEEFDIDDTSLIDIKPCDENNCCDDTEVVDECDEELPNPDEELLDECDGEDCIDEEDDELLDEEDDELLDEEDNELLDEDDDELLDEEDDELLDEDDDELLDEDDDELLDEDDDDIIDEQDDEETPTEDEAPAEDETLDDTAAEGDEEVPAENLGKLISFSSTDPSLLEVFEKVQSGELKLIAVPADYTINDKKIEATDITLDALENFEIEEISDEGSDTMEEAPAEDEEAPAEDEETPAEDEEEPAEDEASENNKGIVKEARKSLRVPCKVTFRKPTGKHPY